MKKKERKGIWIPQAILELTLNGNDKILLAEIYSLCERENGCYASNKHFQKLLGYKTPGAASKRITYLTKRGFITCQNVYEGKRCVGRNIYRNNLMNVLMGVVPNDIMGSDNEPKGISVENTINSITNSSLINSGSSINTGARIIELKTVSKEIPAYPKPSPTTMYQFFKQQQEESAAYLVDATEIGGQIFEFDNPAKFPILEYLIGNDNFQIIKPVLLKFIEAKRMLN